MQLSSSLHKPIRIINKLNHMFITISQGQYKTKFDSLIVTNSNAPYHQQFRITQNDSLNLFYIQPLHRKLTVAPKSGWGDKVYSQVRVEKYDGDINQLWRIIPYDQVMYNQKNQKKHVFQYKPMTDGLINCNKDGQIPRDSSGLGFEYVNANTNVNVNSYTNVNVYDNTNTNIPKQNKQSRYVYAQNHQYKLGYQFESGPHVKAYSKIDPKIARSLNPIHKLNQKQKQSQDIPQVASLVSNSQQAQLTRFPVKQKNNLTAIDKDTKGWFFIENAKYNLVLQIQGGIDCNGMNVVLNRNYGNRNQLWKFQ